MDRTILDYQQYNFTTTHYHDHSAIHKTHPAQSLDTTKLLTIICNTILAAIMFTAVLAIFRVFHRRRRVKQEFQEARLQDPSLTWEEFERRGQLTRSRLLFEEELQRTNMIRKSQQSRASDCQVVVVVEEVFTGSNYMTRPRYSTSPADRGEPDPEKRSEKGFTESSTEIGAEWALAEANVERTWQLLHDRALRISQRTDGGASLVSLAGRSQSTSDAALLQRPPTVRPKTPPLLSHPIFRNGDEQFREKHISLPTELNRAKSGQPMVSVDNAMP